MKKIGALDEYRDKYLCYVIASSTPVGSLFSVTKFYVMMLSTWRTRQQVEENIFVLRTG